MGEGGCPSITGAVTVGMVWIHHAVGDAAAGSGLWWVVAEGHPTALGWRAEVEVGSLAVLSAQTWSREGVSVRAHDTGGHPRVPAMGLATSCPPSAAGSLSQAERIDL